MFIFERQRETEREWGRGRERGRHRIQGRLQALSCQHRAQCGARTHELWDHDWSQSRTSNWLSHPGAPWTYIFLSLFIYLFWRRGGGRAEREGDTESKAGSRLWAVSTEPNTGLEPMNCEIMTWAKGRRLIDWVTQVPLNHYMLN